MSENRSLAVLDKYLLGSADIPDNLPIERIADQDLPDGWSTWPGEQSTTRRLGDAWVERQRSAVLSVPSVIVGERNFVLNPAHPDFVLIKFAEAEPFRFDLRLTSPASIDRQAYGEPV
jgi:RES domain-containing protein